jgi:hypothetical protein
MYEHASEPLLPRPAFVRRVIRHAGGAAALLLGSLLAGMLGYAVLDGLNPVDAFLNAAMILGGMGPVDPLRDNAAKVFAGIYALYSGVVFLVAVGVVFAPLLHRLLHRLHLQAITPADPTGDDTASGDSPAGTIRRQAPTEATPS